LEKIEIFIKATSLKTLREKIDRTGNGDYKSGRNNPLPDLSGSGLERERNKSIKTGEKKHFKTSSGQRRKDGTGQGELPGEPVLRKIGSGGGE